MLSIHYHPWKARSDMMDLGREGLTFHWSVWLDEVEDRVTTWGRDLCNPWVFDPKDTDLCRGLERFLGTAVQWALEGSLNCQQLAGHRYEDRAWTQKTDSSIFLSLQVRCCFSFHAPVQLGLWMWRSSIFLVKPFSILRNNFEPRTSFYLFSSLTNDVKGMQMIVR